MDALLSLLKPLDGPGSVQLLLLCCAIALVLSIWKKTRRAARILLATTLVVYVILALPLVAHGIARGLPPVSKAALWTGQPIDALIVFDGDNRRGRVREAKRVFDRTHPPVVWLLGDAWMWDGLWREGVRYNSIKLDQNMPTTRSQIEWVRRFVSDPSHRSVAIVASRLQMPRVERLLDAERIPALLAPSAADDEPADRGAWQFVPTYLALRISRDALYEHIALWYYRKQGWI